MNDNNKETMVETNIEEIVDRFYENNENLKTLKKVCESDKATIKAYILDSEGQFAIQTNIAMATVTPVTKTTYKEKEFVEFLSKFEIPGLIEYKPVINMDVLEDSIHHNYIDPNDIAPYIIEDTTYRLDIKKVKNKK